MLRGNFPISVPDDAGAAVAGGGDPSQPAGGASGRAAVWLGGCELPEVRRVYLEDWADVPADTVGLRRVQLLVSEATEAPTKARQLLREPPTAGERALPETVLLDWRVVGPVLDAERAAMALWRFHRRAARDGAGRKFSLTSYRFIDRTPIFLIFLAYGLL